MRKSVEILFCLAATLDEISNQNGCHNSVTSSRLISTKPLHNRRNSITMEEMEGDRGDTILPERETSPFLSCFDGSDKTLSKLSLALSYSSFQMLGAKPDDE